MRHIHVLSFEIANLIAAGEVVERPSSVVKELLENAIDAGSKHIVAEIKHGGVSLIRVSDDGCGIDSDDLPVSLRRHATSKIHSASDLEHITTLGFRGEALAAIASVSKLTIITKTADAENGSMLTSEAGEIREIEEVGASFGTTVVVEDLFFNIPARRKFLKKDMTEALNVAALVERVALSKPDVSIQFCIDGEERFKTPGNGSLQDTVYAVYGRDFADKLLKVDGEANGIHVFGFVGRSDNVRKNRNLENVFINGRYVKSLTVGAALEKAYVSYIAPECFPSCVLFLEMNPAFVDVNVHPAKLEVKFTDERSIFEIVYYTVRRALEEGGYRPEFMTPKREKDYKNTFVAIGEETKGKQIVMPKLTFGESKRQPQTDVGAKVASPAPAPKPNVSRNTLSPKASLDILAKASEQIRRAQAEEAKYAAGGVISSSPSLDYKYIGEAFNCYLLVEYNGDLLMIDKHAAHERIIFEDLKKAREKDGRVSSQVLLLPFSVLLTPEEISALSDFREEFENVGFAFDFNEKGATVSAVPDCISPADAEKLFIEMTDSAASGKGDPTVTAAIRNERALYQIACKAAIKGGRLYETAVIRWLIEKLLSIPDITVCPHGRPVAYKITKHELDKKFDRIK